MANTILVPTGEGLSKKLNGEDVNLPPGKWVAWEDLLKQQEEERQQWREAETTRLVKEDMDNYNKKAQEVAQFKNVT